MKAGGLKIIIQWIEVPSIEATKQLYNHKGIALVLATGGSGMVSLHINWQTGIRCGTR